MSELVCPRCKGRGKTLQGVDLPILGISPDVYGEVPCTRCNGTGDYIPLEELLSQITNKGDKDG